MARRYWVHRNNVEPLAVPKKMFLRNYLSIGWSAVADIDNILTIASEDNQAALKKIVDETYYVGHKRESIRNFAMMQLDDIVLVPALEEDKFCICRVLEPAVSVCNMEFAKFQDANGRDVFQLESGLLAHSVRGGEPQVLDVGFLIKIQKLTADMDRSFASSKLRGLMGRRGINVNADEFGEEIEKLIEG